VKKRPRAGRAPKNVKKLAVTWAPAILTRLTGDRQVHALAKGVDS
jgi:hypothetical protein